MVVEAGVIAGYLIAWALRKARRAGHRLDAEVDAVVDGCLDRLHEVVAAKLSGHPALAELEDEAGGSPGEVTELTRQQIELGLAAAARRDEAFGRVVMELMARLREAGSAPVIGGAGQVIFAGDADAHAEGGGIAIGQAGVVNMGRDPAGPL